MGLKADFLLEDSVQVHTQSTRLDFVVEALNSFGNPASLSDFSNAEYHIVDNNDNIVVRKTLGDGIIQDNHYYRVSIPASEMNFSGSHRHAFYLYNTLGEVLEPVFNDIFYIKPTTFIN